jgi:hypothetical protein
VRGRPVRHSVVVPAFNEAGRIRQTLEELLAPHTPRQIPAMFPSSAKITRSDGRRVLARQGG